MSSAIYLLWNFWQISELHWLLIFSSVKWVIGLVILQFYDPVKI